MRRAESEPLTAWSVAWDAWRAKRGGPAAIAARQQARLQALVEYARRASRFYAEHYRAVPSGPIRLEELDRLPSVTKPELMARFDDWVTDPAVIRVAVEEFVANLDNLGRDFLDRYVVFTTSGSTGVPASLAEHQRRGRHDRAGVRPRSQRLEPEACSKDADPISSSRGRGLCPRRPLPTR